MKRDVQTSILQATARFIRRHLDPVVERLASLEQKAITAEKLLDSLQVREVIAGVVDDRVKGLPAPQRGEKGEPGRDADPIDMKDVAAELVNHPGLKALVDLLVAEGIAKHMADNPVRDGRDGKDGRDGADGARGERGERGEKGDDGVGLASAMIDRDGVLIVTTSKGEAHRLGNVVGRDGADGKDGRDGLSVENLSRTYIPETHEIVERWTAGDIQKELRYPAGGIHGRGYWREGVRAQAGDAWTDGGQLWVAKRETSARPSHAAADDWFLAAAKGREGPAGAPGKDYVPPSPVKLKD